MEYLIQEPKNIHTKTPILILLHGYGSDEKDLFSFSQDFSSEWIIISLRAPIPLPNGGFCWYDIDFLDKEKFINIPQAEESIRLIMNQISEIKNKYNTNSDIHLCGFSQGGVLSYAISLRFPNLFKKVACLSTYPEIRLLQKTPIDKNLFKDLKFFISHGENDIVVPIEWGKTAIELLYNYNIFFSFRQYNHGHGINYNNYQDLISFFKE